MRVEGVHHAIPKEIGDAEVALLAVEMMRKMKLLHLPQPFPAWLERQMLNAVAELVEAGGQDARRRGGSSTGSPAMAQPSGMVTMAIVGRVV